MIRIRSTLRLLLGILSASRLALGLLPSDQLSQYGRQSWETGNGLPQNTVTALAQTLDGFLWVGTEGGLARFDGYSFYLLPEFQGQAVTALWVRSGELQVTVGTKTFVFHNGQFAPSTGIQPEPEPISIPNLTEQPTATLLDLAGAVWVGTHSGLFRYREGKLEAFSPSDPLSAAEILALLEDNEGNIWAGTGDSGLQLIKQERFVTYGTDRIRAVIADQTHAWFGTDGHGLLQLDTNKLLKGGALPSDIVLSLALSDRGLLAGTANGLQDLGAARHSWTSGGGLPDDFIRSLFVDKDGTVWAGTRRGLTHIAGEQILTYTQANGLGSDLVGAITRDKSGLLWVATLGGLSHMTGANTFKNYTVANGLSSNVITDLYCDREGVLWIATQGGGLNRFAGDLFTHGGHDEGVPETIYAVTDDHNGNLWLAAPDGIYSVAKRQFEHPDLVAAYGTSDGLRVASLNGGGHPGVFKDQSGGIWFATMRGAAYLSREHAELHGQPPLTVLEGVSVNDSSISPYTAADIQPGHTRIAFEYAGIHFSNPQSVRYRYQLTAFDSGWVNAGARRTAFYTNLGPGEYTFRVSATDGRGPWRPVAASFAFRVRPFFYQTWWFRILGVICLALLISAIVRWRVRRVRAAFRAVLNERTRIAREIHDTLAQGFVGILVHLEVVSRLLASPEKARPYLDQARTLARKSIDEARRTIWELRSQQTEADELPGRLAKLAREAAESSGMDVQFQVRGTYRPLDQRTENEIARIAQEALQNAVRHSGAQRIEADLIFEGENLRLTIADDGCGMKSVVSRDGHYGLTGMRERAATIGGEFSIISREGEGTTVSLEAPIR